MLLERYVMKNSLTRYTAVPSLFNRDEFLTPFSNFFDEVFNSRFPDLHSDLGVDFFGKGTYPKVNVRDEETEVVIEAEIPGLTKEQVSVEIQDGILRIKGEKRQEDETKKKNYIHRELKQSSFCRSFTLNENLDQSQINAKFENGLLEIVLKKLIPSPKKDNVKKIEIK